MLLTATLHRCITLITASVWLISGLVCKVLGLVPRHEAIVARILGGDHAHLLTKAIGCAEIGLAIWVFSGITPYSVMVLQISLISAMNFLEYWLASDLLLWGRMNSVFACGFIALILCNDVFLAAHLRSGRGRNA